MKPFAPRQDASTEPAAADASDAEGVQPEESASELAGDRGIPSLNRARSVQSRLSSLLAVSLMSILGLGLLTWYYAKALTRPGQAHQAAQAAVKQHAQGEMALPPLGHISPPVLKEALPPITAPDPMLAQALGPPPPLPAPGGAFQGAAISQVPSTMPADGNPPKSPAALALERKLAGPAFATSAAGTVGGSAAGAGAIPVGLAQGESATGSSQTLNGLLQPTITPAQAASVLPTRRFLLAKGAFIDCTLETAIDSTLPGMTTCITATDTFSADGTVVLLERGTKLVGETRGEVQQGSSRIFVLWSEARTPTGVTVPLSSPGLMSSDARGFRVRWTVTSGIALALPSSSPSSMVRFRGP